MSAILSALVLLLAGCASMRNTPQQEYVMESFNYCKTAGRTNQPVTLDRVEPDGRYWYRFYLGGDQRTFLDCMATYRREHPFLDWLKAQKRDTQQPLMTLVE